MGENVNLTSWGGRHESTHITPAIEVSDVVKTVCGETFVIFLTKEGQLYSWGQSEDGWLVKKEQTSKKRVYRIDEQHRYKDVSVGSLHVLAIRENGEVVAWGNNTFKQLGIGIKKGESKNNVLKKLAIPLCSKVFAHNNSSFAVTMSGDLYAWGDNAQSLLGIASHGDVDTPTQVMLKDNMKITDLIFRDNRVFAVNLATSEPKRHVQEVEEEEEKKEEIVLPTLKQSRSQSRSDVQGENEELYRMIKEARELASKLRDIDNDCLNILKSKDYRREKELMHLYDELYNAKESYFLNKKQSFEPSNHISPKLKTITGFLKEMLDDVFSLRSLNLGAVKLIIAKDKLVPYHLFALDKVDKDERIDISQSTEEVQLELKKMYKKLKQEQNIYTRLSVGMDNMSYNTQKYMHKSIMDINGLWITVGALYTDILNYRNTEEKEEVKQQRFKEIEDLYADVQKCSLDAEMEKKRYDSTEYESEYVYIMSRIEIVASNIDTCRESLEVKLRNNVFDHYYLKTLSIIEENIELRKFLLACHSKLIDKTQRNDFNHFY